LSVASPTFNDDCYHLDLGPYFFVLVTVRFPNCYEE